MNLLVTICARAGSKGVKNKNIREFCGKPLLYHTLASYREFLEQYGEQYQQIQLALNTDSELLLEQMSHSGLQYIYIPREEELAGDAIAKICVIRDTLQKVEQQTNTRYEAIIDLDLTAPLRTAYDIEGTVDALVKNPEADISFSVTESRRSPYFNMVCKQENGYYNTVIPSQYVSRQQVPVCYDMNASIYAYDRNYLLSEKNEERKAVIWKMRDTAVLDIDSEEDYELMTLLYKYFTSIS
ncbi:MAG: acylneuraminate cytidylyltransferase family protein [Lachnospiraceae bacterium]